MFILFVALISVLQGVGAVHLQKLQLIQNGAARVVARKKNFDPIMSTIRDKLHWLPVAQRIHFKQCMLVYRSLHGMAPAYITDMCVKRTFDSERYNLRSAVAVNSLYHQPGKQPLDVVVLHTVVRHFGMHYRMIFETLL